MHDATLDPVRTTRIGIHFEDWAPALARDLATAQHCIYLTFLSAIPPTRRQAGPGPDLWATICNAAERRIHVRLLLPAPSGTHPATLFNARAAACLTQYGAQVTLLRSPRLMHAKTASIDGTIAWIGSGNLTAAAAAHNREAWVRCEDPAMALALQYWHGEQHLTL